MTLHYYFVIESNQEDLSKKLLTWLYADFIAQGSSIEHFWHNSDLILGAFQQSRAMLVLDEMEQVVGYMTWTFYNEIRAEIDIVEVEKSHRKQGVFRKMLRNFIEEYSTISFLSATPISQSEIVFTRLGWEKTVGPNRDVHFFKILKPVVSEQNFLPQGHVIALASEADFYSVKREPLRFRMRYFQIQPNVEGKLAVPIIAPFHHEGYVGLYLDGKLIADGKAKHLFTNRTCHSYLNLFALDNMIFSDPQLQSYFLQPQLQQNDSITENSEKDEDQPDCKRKCTESRYTLFQPEDSTAISIKHNPKSAETSSMQSP